MRQDSAFPLGAKIVLALALLGVLGAIILTARAGDGGMLDWVAIRQERVVAAIPRVSMADIMVSQNDWLVVRLPSGWKLAPIGEGVLGQSMQPGLGPGHKIIYAPASDYGVGDVVVYNLAPGTAWPNMAHRIVETGTDEQGWYAITKGDNVFDRDAGKLRREQILGVVLVEIK